MPAISVTNKTPGLPSRSVILTFTVALVKPDSCGKQTSLWIHFQHVLSDPYLCRHSEHCCCFCHSSTFLLLQLCFIFLHWCIILKLGVLFQNKKENILILTNLPKSSPRAGPLQYVYILVSQICVCYQVGMKAHFQKNPLCSFALNIYQIWSWHVANVDVESSLSRKTHINEKKWTYWCLQNLSLYIWVCTGIHAQVLSGDTAQLEAQYHSTNEWLHSLLRYLFNNLVIICLSHFYHSEEIRKLFNPLTVHFLML